jgi:histidinol-phosphatase (PHP family)
MADSYYELLFNLTNCGLFDVIGHADYYLRHGVLYYGEEIINAYKGRLNRVVEAAVRTKTGFELNTAQSGYGDSDFYPRIDFLKNAVKMGAEINSIGSDSHHVDHLGANINKALAMLGEHGIPFKPFYKNG